MKKSFIQMYIEHLKEAWESRPAFKQMFLDAIDFVACCIVFPFMPIIILVSVITKWIRINFKKN